MSPCDEYKKLVKEWNTARSNENYWRPENRNVHGKEPVAATEQAETVRKQADSLKRAMERHVQVCNACKS